MANQSKKKVEIEDRLVGNFSFLFVQGSSSSAIVDNSLSIALVSQRNKRREERKVERENEKAEWKAEKKRKKEEKERKKAVKAAEEALAQTSSGSGPTTQPTSSSSQVPPPPTVQLNPAPTVQTNPTSGTQPQMAPTLPPGLGLTAINPQALNAAQSTQLAQLMQAIALFNQSLGISNTVQPGQGPTQVMAPTVVANTTQGTTPTVLANMTQTTVRTQWF